MRLASMIPVAILFVTVTAQASDVRAVLAPVHQRIEAADYRATGQFVVVDAAGKRINYAISIKARWLAGGLHTLVEIVPSGKTHQDSRMRILLEMRPNGADSIRVAHSGDPGSMVLPSDKWGEPLLGSDFNYEDFLEPESYWPGQEVLKTVQFGARTCDILKSTPGAMDHSPYSEIKTWLDHTIDYPVYTEKTLKDGGAVKEFTSYGIRQYGGVWSATQVEAKIRGRAGSTLLIVKRGSTKANLGSKDFSPDQISHFEDRP